MRNISLKVGVSASFINPSSNVFEILLYLRDHVLICQIMCVLGMQMGSLGLIPLFRYAEKQVRLKLKQFHPSMVFLCLTPIFFIFLMHTGLESKGNSIPLG